MTKIQYASDLHLEFADNWRYLKEHPLKPSAEILVLAGDIGYIGDENYRCHPFWDWAAENYEQVIVVPGNHEFYKFTDVTTFPDGYCQEIRPNIHLYYNRVIHIGETDIIVSTLWAHIPKEEETLTEQAITDFRRILYNGDLMDAYGFNSEHKRCLSFIKQALADSTAKHKIVVTHHVPSFSMQCPAYADSKINGAFTVELQDFIAQSDIDYWIYGHSHYNVDVKIGNTMCVSNQLGYVFHNEHLTFNQEKTISI